MDIRTICWSIGSTGSTYLSKTASSSPQHLSTVKVSQLGVGLCEPLLAWFCAHLGLVVLWIYVCSGFPMSEVIYYPFILQSFLFFAYVLEHCGKSNGMHVLFRNENSVVSWKYIFPLKFYMFLVLDKGWWYSSYMQINLYFLSL